MAQFSVYRNTNPASRAAYPLLLDVQSDLTADLGTRVVVPLCPASTMQGRLIRTLTPVLQVEGQPYAMLTPQLAGVPTGRLGNVVTNLAECRGEIVAALDLLITGI